MGMLDDGESVLLKKRTHSELLGEMSLLNHLQSSTVVLIPLRENGKTAFVLLAGHGNETEGVSEERFTFLISLSQPISAALEKARVFESERKRTLQLLLIHEISRSLSSILDINRVFQEYARLLQRHFQFRHISIFTLDDFGHPWLRAQAGNHVGNNLPEDAPNLRTVCWVAP